jgi:lipid A 4'-phosphatase
VSLDPAKASACDLCRSVTSAALKAPLLLLVIGVAAALTLWGGIDKGFSALFYEPGRGFPAWHNPLAATLRLSTRGSAFGVGIFLLFALLWRVILGRPLFALRRAAVVYLIAVFLLGPALIVNGVLKEEWGRARPSQIVEFGGDKHYTPPLIIAHECSRNCSFVSGEASLGFAFVAFGFAALTPRRRRLGIAAGLTLGSAFGLLRIAQGGHFLSDVYFAGVLMVALAWLLHELLIERRWLDRLGLWPTEGDGTR